MNGIEHIYKEIAPLKGCDHAYLVLHQENGRVYVKKYLNVYSLEVYKQLSSLHNLHIPRIYAYEEQESNLCIIEEYINGKTLLEQISSGTLFSEQDTLQIALKICEVLSYLHTQNPPIIHRDLKLSNVMYTEDGILKLIDYNAARFYVEGMGQDTTLIGTINYAAPEQFGFAQTDARTDIYSLGVMMNYMLTGQFSQSTLYSKSPKIEAIIRRCTHLDPEKRYQTAADLTKDLKKLLESNSEPKITLHQLLPLPGFRTKKLWKMLIATLGYLTLFLIISDLELKEYEGMFFAMLMYRIMIGLWSLFLIALCCNYANIRTQFPFLTHSNRLIRLFFLFLFGFLGLVLAFVILDVFVFLIYG